MNVDNYVGKEIGSLDILCLIILNFLEKLSIKEFVEMGCREMEF